MSAFVSVAAILVQAAAVVDEAPQRHGGVWLGAIAALIVAAWLGWRWHRRRRPPR